VLTIDLSCLSAFRLDEAIKSAASGATCNPVVTWRYQGVIGGQREVSLARELQLAAVAEKTMAALCGPDESFPIVTPKEEASGE